MAFKDLHKLKKIQEVQKENVETDYLVLGHDLFAISIFKKLVEKYGADKVRLLSQEKFELKDLSPKGPSGVRGADNINCVKQLLHPGLYNEIALQSQFYKDMQWKVFGGRSKSEALKFHEEHFTEGRLDIHYGELFPHINDETFLSWLNELAYAVKVKSIHYANEKYTVECVNGTEFTTGHLISGITPFEFLNLYKNKNELADKFIEFCESTISPSALFVKFDFKKPLTDLTETLFIPLSYTHEWGHYVGEFTTKEDIQSVDFVHFIDKDQMTEEDVSRIIRGIKKNLEKIFQQPKNLPVKEYISIEDASGCLKIDDELYRSVSANFSNLHFIGFCAPVSVAIGGESSSAYSFALVNYEARALLSLKNLEGHYHL